jgi:hypothetical protein
MSCAKAATITVALPDNEMGVVPPAEDVTGDRVSVGPVDE